MARFLVTTSTAFGLIVLAEIGDKSQLVCMTLAARQRALPVLAGAVLAFAVLNLLAVVFGAALAGWLPAWLVAAAVALLFAGFGIHLLRTGAGGQGDLYVPERRDALLSALLLIFAAEFGDKTQLAVAGLASTAAALPVWLGATLALTVTSTLGVLAGRALLRRIPLQFVHRLSGILFLVLALVAAARAVGGM